MSDVALLETLTEAFAKDPLYRWLYPDPATRPHALRANLELTLACAHDGGIVDTDPTGTAVALWTDPGVELLTDPAPFLDLLDRWAPTRRDAALAGMARCAYLESSNERNLSFYRRCGFELLGEVEVPDGGPVMRPMRRPPRTDATD